MRTFKLVACIVLLCATFIMPCHGKKKIWTTGTVVALDESATRFNQLEPGKNEYTVRMDKTDYTLEHAAFFNFSSKPVPLLKPGDVVQICLDGKHAIVKTDSFEKRLRIVKVRSVLK
jgi:hypothetical protein